MSFFHSSVIACEQCIPCVTRAQHASNLQNFPRHELSHMFFVNLDVSCIVCSFIMLARKVICDLHY